MAGMHCTARGPQATFRVDQEDTRRHNTLASRQPLKNFNAVSQLGAHLDFPRFKNIRRSLDEYMPFLPRVDDRVALHRERIPRDTGKLSAAEHTRAQHPGNIRN